MAKLKVFRYTAYSPTMARSLGQPAHRNQVEAIIATTSQAKAAEALGVTLGEFRNYGGETKNAESLNIAFKHPGEAIYSPLDSNKGPWALSGGTPVHND